MKKCTHCGELKSLTEFGKETKNNDGKSGACKKCLYIQARQNPNYNKTQRKKNKDIKKRNLEYVRSKKTKCTYCPENTSICLDFHHTNPSNKYMRVSDMIHNKLSLKKIQKEIDKCIVVCANCHRKLHADLLDLDSVTLK